MFEGELPFSISCDCGEEYQILVASGELDGYVTTCPACAKEHRFADHQIADLRRQGQAFVEDASKIAHDYLTQGLSNLPGYQKKR